MLPNIRPRRRNIAYQANGSSLMNEKKLRIENTIVAVCIGHGQEDL